jgi:PAS domain S-box-containing protein
MAKFQPADLARIREQAVRLLRGSPHALPKVSPQNVEALVHELRVHQIELELQCQELQQAHLEVEESRNRYRELYESIPIGYATIDVSGRIYHLNPAGAAALGIESDNRELFFFFFFSNSDVNAATQYVYRTMDEGKQETIEFTMKKLDGTPFTAALQAAPVEHGEGKGERLRVTFKDVSRRRAVEEALRQHQMELEANRVELQDLMAKLFTAQEEERRRIACDLHDDHCQRITALILEASAMEKVIRSVVPSLVPRMSSLKIKLSDILDDFRHMTHELHPRHLDTVSLACSMRTYIKDYAAYSKLEVHFQEHDVPAQLPMPLTICLYRVLQESLGNIRKHANAKQVAVSLSGTAGHIELRVSDNGSGFNSCDNKKGLGLTSMQERVRPLRGQVIFDSRPDVGTVVTVRIPVPSET